MKKIDSPIQIGRMSLGNRLVMPPMATGKASAEQNIAEEIYEYYCEHARHSKVSLIIVEHCYIHQQGKAHPGQMSIASDETIPGFQKLTDVIHVEGVKVIAQINHAGSATVSEITGQSPVAPSAVSHPKHPEVIPEEMTKDQIQDVVTWFANAALRAKKAGFDGVEIHSAHSYLLNQFYSPITNHRTDEYGAQSVENRTRFHCQVIKAVKNAVGDDFCVAIRLGGCDYTNGGSTIDDCVKACMLFEENGVDLIDLTGGMKGYVRPNHTEPGYFKDMSIPVKKAVHVPVILTGGVTSPDEADALLAEESADLIGVGRAMFKNVHWADK